MRFYAKLPTNWILNDFKRNALCIRGQEFSYIFFSKRKNENIFHFVVQNLSEYVLLIMFTLLFIFFLFPFSPPQFFVSYQRVILETLSFQMIQNSRNALHVEIWKFPRVFFNKFFYSFGRENFWTEKLPYYSDSFFSFFLLPLVFVRRFAIYLKQSKINIFSHIAYEMMQTCT